ncbi:vitamin K epoxide reductase family protein [Thioalkalivibrio thiocyanodenitrificans]|uniref:vitamin K epoxide reductase family protein n=1 Tax=Thioalkalivibrio thiocyanodenitrificans TaxID=243063 RepID=UPI00036C2F5E|nr:vitamin K epoxide reductase family protein [Thioalkalivibrio thiocyanodenitrificans]
MAKTRRKPSRKAESRPAPAAAAHAPEWTVVGLAALGMLITAYLTLVAWTGAGPALCAEGSGCDVVQQSRWSRVLGLPVALWGFGVYALLALIAYAGAPRLKRWRRLWMIAFIGLSISAYLTVMGIVALDAVCIWCLLSLAIITALFVWLTFRRPATAPGMPWLNWSLSSVVVAAVIVGTLHAYYSDLFSPPADPRLERLALHLDDTGARYYGAYWCPACQQQNRLFRGAYEHLPYVECSPDGRHGRPAGECVTAGISNFPTWIIRGRRYEEILTPEELARHSGFDWQGARGD